jgi:hypothetical protein
MAVTVATEAVAAVTAVVAVVVNTVVDPIAGKIHHENLNRKTLKKK